MCRHGSHWFLLQINYLNQRKLKKSKSWELFTICLLNGTADIRPFNLHLDYSLIQTLEKFQVLQTWFFSVCHLDFFQVYSINLAFFLGGDLKKIQVCMT